ncbi:MAG: adenine phosphoribosyltransferase [Flavobacteriales bacterium]
MPSLNERIESAITDVIDFPKPGIVYKDITPIFQNPELCKDILDAMKQEYANQSVEAVLGMESRGFLFGLPLAMALDVPFILVRKKGKLPREAYAVSYSLEYGEAIIEMHKDALTPNQKVLIHDDVLATGGTAKAAAQLVEMANAQVVGFSFLTEISFLKGKEALEHFGAKVSSFVQY